MLPYHRLFELFQYINTHDSISTHQLAEQFKVSDRTIRSDILLLNKILNAYDTKIILLRKIGYHLIINNQNKYDLFLKEISLNETANDLDSVEDRIKFLISKLLYLKNYISLDELANMVYISKNTMINYTKTIKHIIQKYDLEYISKINQGIKIIGTEEQKRKCLLEKVLSCESQNNIIGFSQNDYNLFKGIDIDYIKKVISKVLSTQNIKANDYNLKNLILHFALLVSRIRNGDSLEIENNIIKEEHIEKCVNIIIEELSTFFAITVSNAEKNYIFQHLITNTDASSITPETEDIESIIVSLLANIHRNYNFDLKKDSILCHDLYMHFKSILKSKSYSLNKRNPLLNTIKLNFPLSFEITLTAIAETFANLQYRLTEDEIGYVSLHIGAAIERCFTGVIQRKNVILICGSGQATTRMLEARINSFFKDKIIISKKMSYHEFVSVEQSSLKNIDFAISTIPIKNSIIPTICVNFALNNKDIESITKFLATISSDKIQKINKFFDESIFVQADSFKSKEDILKHMCNLFVTNKITDSNFYDSVMKRENIASTNMNDVFALPHPMELCALQTKVGVVIIKEPIKWNDKSSVQIILLLAIKQDEHLDIEHLYDLFIQIVNNPKLQNEIIHCENLKGFINTLKDAM